MSDLTIEFKGQEIEVEIISYSHGRPAITNLAPENCSPAEYPEVEFKIATSNRLLNDVLIEKHEDEITELVFDAIEKDIAENANADSADNTF